MLIVSKMINLFDVKDIDKDFGAYFSYLTENLVSKLPNPSNKYGLLSAAKYYSNLGLTKIFDLLLTKKDFERYQHLKSCWH